MAYELTGKVHSLSFDYLTEKAVLSLVIDNKQSAGACFQNLQKMENLSIKIDKQRKKRSLNANSYAWLIIGKIADIHRTSKEEVYLDMLKHYGQSEIISVLSHVPIEWYVKYYEEIGKSTLNGKEFTHYKVFKGSSEYDTTEMSIFVDGVVQEAQALGIETKTPAEIAEMKSLWGVA
jgi:hypothetical protein